MDTSAVPLLLLLGIAAFESRAKKVEISQGATGAWMSQGHSHQQKSTVPSGLRQPQSPTSEGFALQGHIHSCRNR